MSQNSDSRPAYVGCVLGIAVLGVFMLFLLPLPLPPAFAQNNQPQGSNSASGLPSLVLDPGPRGSPVGAGRPIANLTADQLRFFNDGAARFVHSEAVANGLGPTFNADSCGACHSQPANGGTSPSANAFPNVGANPQVALATANGGKNSVPFFVTANGPVREARFKFLMNRNGSLDTTQPDGSVHDLFTIQGRNDAPAACVLPQEDFLAAATQHNLALRIPTPTFGGGFIEMIDDRTILANMLANQAIKSALGIRGKPNRNGNDATISRFGWKAQNKSLIMFSHEAYSVEIGETNQMFPQKRGFFPNPPPPQCIANSLPEDQTNYLPIGSDTVSVPSDDDAFATFMRFLDQPTPACSGPTCSPSIQNGNRLFTTTGCALCHTPSMTTGQSVFSVNPPGLSGVQANLFSDLLLHHMGVRLHDGISQGNAGPDEFRTAPLWGLGQRLFFLHDGRTSDLLQVIREHQSTGSEANGVINNFNQLKPAEKQDILNFLRSL
ncbi:MAG: thiol oxidoreductase [Acidobacteria bacterium]|nr:thiol oxidoreductase [Acidobacteriota bacterium]MBV9625392.1 thiol oxidoreductase [Acidobacteriota bacterium]